MVTLSHAVLYQFPRLPFVNSSYYSDENMNRKNLKNFYKIRVQNTAEIQTKVVKYQPSHPQSVHNPC